MSRADLSQDTVVCATYEAHVDVSEVHWVALNKGTGACKLAGRTLFEIEHCGAVNVPIVDHSNLENITV